MACVMEPCFVDSSFLQQGLPLVLIAAWIYRFAVRLSEHPAALVPLGTSVLPLPVLKIAMFDDQGEELIR